MRESVISLVFAICLAALLVFVVILAARLRAASSYIAELRAQRDRDVETIARARGEALAMATLSEEAARAQAALADAQAALATVRADRDQSRLAVEAARRQHHAFLAGLAHDLRNPLAPLSNGIELLRLTDGDAAARLRTRGIIERQVGNLLRIADDLSELARLGSDHPALQDSTFELDDVMRGLGDRLRPLLQAQEMSLVIRPEPGGPGQRGMPRLRGDAQRLSQAFGNLVADLMRHCERGSTVVVSAHIDAVNVGLRFMTATDLPAVPPDLDCTNSAGAADDADSLVEVDASLLGLGVALADQVIALHAGHLMARRRPGARRARFEVSLPLPRGEASPAAAAVPLSMAAPAAEPPLSVLLADDNIDFSHSFGTMLELLGHRVDVVHDGLAAVASMVGSPPDIAFVDIGMPSLDGVEAVRRVRGQGNTQDVFLVAVTGRGGTEDRARAVEAGFDRYLVKPFAMQDVREALDAAQAIRAGGASRAPGNFAGASGLLSTATTPTDA